MSRLPRLLLAAGVWALVLLTPAGALADHSVGSPSQITWVRSAATRFVTAELAANGAEACAVLNAPMRADHGGQSCTDRWDGRLHALLHQPGERARLHSERRAVPSAVVVVAGGNATIQLPEPLLNGTSRFVWSESCWMLKS